MSDEWNTIPRHEGSYFDDLGEQYRDRVTADRELTEEDQEKVAAMLVPRDPQPPSEGTIFRRRLELLRMELGVRCETCQFYDVTHGENGGVLTQRCTLHWRWQAPGDFCESWSRRE